VLRNIGATTSGKHRYKVLTVENIAKLEEMVTDRTGGD
jgi:hypothetical protein